MSRARATSGSGADINCQAETTRGSQITALPILLGFLDLKGCIVTADAMGGQKAIATRADYGLAVKGRQSKLF